MRPDRRPADPQREPLFPSARAFIVQFTRDAEVGAEVGIRGRIEHVTSGQSTRFTTADDLFNFVREIMKDAADNGSMEVGS